MGAGSAASGGACPQRGETTRRLLQNERPVFTGQHGCDDASVESIPARPMSSLAVPPSMAVWASCPQATASGQWERV